MPNLARTHANCGRRGRVTGRDYATPVWAFGTRDGLVVALLYGANSDWVSVAGLTPTPQTFPRPLTGDRAERPLFDAPRMPFRAVERQQIRTLPGTRNGRLPGGGP
jgi:hypothetical protein